MAVNSDELSPEVKEKLKIDKLAGRVPLKITVLGRVLALFEGLTTRDALWVCRTAHEFAHGYKRVQPRKGAKWAKIK